MCVCVWGVCGKTDYTATLKVFRVRVLSVAIKGRRQKLLRAAQTRQEVSITFSSDKTLAPKVAVMLS